MEPLAGGTFENKVRVTIAALLGLAIAAMIGILLYASGILVERDLGEVPGWALFVLWAVSPYLFALLICCRQKVGGARLWIRGVVAVLLAILGTAVCVTAFFFSESSTSALVVIFIPFYQWVILLVAFGLSFLWKGQTKESA